MRYVLALILLAGCSRVDSSDIMTGGFYPEFSATANGDGKLQVSASLRIGDSNSNTYADLKSGDQLVAIYDGERALIRQQGLFGNISYTSSFGKDDLPMPVVIELRRETGDSAPGNSTLMPGPFAISLPSPSFSFSRMNEGLAVAWTPSENADNFQITVTGTCITSGTKDVAKGVFAYQFPAGSLKGGTGHENDTCDVTVAVRARRPGTVDPIFKKGGRFDGVHQRQVTVVARP